GNEIACKLDDLLKNTHDTVFVLGMDRTILFCNRQIKDVFGWPESHVVGKDFMEFICSDEDRALMGSLVDRIKSSGEWDGELRIRHKDGHDVVVQSHAVLTYQENNNPILLIFNQDISEMRSIENQFFRYQRMENIGLLSSGIVHDLNNILTPIFVSVHALKPKLLDKQSKLIVSLLEASAIRGQQLVKQLLGYAQGKDCGLSRLDLKPIILELEDIVQKTFPKEISFVSDISDDLWHLQGDAVQLHQMLLNLCINARDAMPKGGTLVFSAANKTISNEPFVRLNLVDSGIGMSKELMAKIFDPFFTTKENGKGTGLGLSTVLSIIKKHGGELNVVSDKGKGATFEIYLPAITPE
ncbi:MAG: two-component system cell cycle sensor histidine kinase/response regulator CckA, partial [Candidatus Marinamargulisbacteria bacterium]